MIVGCRFCTPELDPQGPRKGEGHFGVRWGFDDVLMGVSKDGVPLYDVYEVEAPHRAWRYRLVGPALPTVCGCGSNEPEAFLDESGGFTVTRTLGDPPQ